MAFVAAFMNFITSAIDVVHYGQFQSNPHESATNRFRSDNHPFSNVLSLLVHSIMLWYPSYCCNNSRVLKTSTKLCSLTFHHRHETQQTLCHSWWCHSLPRANQSWQACTLSVEFLDQQLAPVTEQWTHCWQCHQCDLVSWKLVQWHILVYTVVRKLKDINSEIHYLYNARKWGDTVALLVGHLTCNSQVVVQVLVGHNHTVALDKLLTCVCLCHKAV